VAPEVDGEVDGRDEAGQDEQALPECGMPLAALQAKFAVTEGNRQIGRGE